MISQDFERLVLHGLCCEWQGAAMELRPPERKGLVQPLFAIRDLKGRWGTWSSELREISLSSDLVHHHPWDAVREVLLHEMAHQVADQVLHARNETPHGPAFRKACRMLRANPRASGNRPLLDQRLSDDFRQGEEKILVRIRKLMALAQ
ncbi:MAG: SprT-like domain-containing protein, partial [Deltaproteobacteria bacterium]|nr:SprT-like domain-containing protein [Deltaproteobacteria bacterium]